MLIHAFSLYNTNNVAESQPILPVFNSGVHFNHRFSTCNHPLTCIQLNKPFVEEIAVGQVIYLPSVAINAICAEQCKMQLPTLLMKSLSFSDSLESNDTQKHDILPCNST